MIQSEAPAKAPGTRKKLLHTQSDTVYKCLPCSRITSLFLKKKIKISEKDQVYASILCNNGQERIHLMSPSQGEIQASLVPTSRRTTISLGLAASSTPIVLNYPQRWSTRQILAVINENSKRFDAYLDRFMQTHPGAKDGIRFKDTLALGSRKLPLSLFIVDQADGGFRVAAMRETDTLLSFISLNNHNCRLYASREEVVLAGDRDDRDSMALLLRCHIRKTAEYELPDFVRSVLRADAGVLKNITITDASTRWGSLSNIRGQTGLFRMHLNWRSILLSGELLRHLIAHEFSHSKAMNHQKEFYHHLAMLSPDWQRLEGELNHAWTSLPLWTKGKTPKIRFKKYQ